LPIFAEEFRLGLGQFIPDRILKPAGPVGQLFRGFEKPMPVLDSLRTNLG
jgi:hypothetical protein